MTCTALPIDIHGFFMGFWASLDGDWLMIWSSLTATGEDTCDEPLESAVEWTDPETGQQWVRCSTPGRLVSDVDQFFWDPSDSAHSSYRRACAALWSNFELPIVEYRP
jgi:hypothetical protein